MNTRVTTSEETSGVLAEHTAQKMVSEKKPTQTERKAAFAALYRVVKASLCIGRTTDDLKRMHCQQDVAQIEEALYALARAIHGEPKPWQYGHLCDCCGLRVSEHFAKEPGKELSTWCCSACYTQMQVEGTFKKEEYHGRQK